MCKKTSCLIDLPGGRSWHNQMPFADVERSQTQARGHLSYLQIIRSKFLEREIILVLPVNCYKYTYKGGGGGGEGATPLTRFCSFFFFLFFKSILSQKLSLTFFITLKMRSRIFLAHFRLDAKRFWHFTYLSFLLGMIGCRLNSVATFSSLILFRSQSL